MSIKCNLSDEEAKAIFSGFTGVLEPEEEKRIAEIFHGNLFYHAEGKQGRRFWCEKCGNYYYEDKKSYPSMFGKHGSVCRCSHCNKTATLICDGMIRSGKTLNDKKTIILVRADPDGGLRLTAMIAYKKYEMGYDNYLQPYFEYVETKRYYFHKGKRCCWKNQLEWVCGYSFHAGGWKREDSIRTAFTQGMNYYSDTFDGYANVIGGECIHDSFAKYSQVENWVVGHEEIMEHDRVKLMEKYLALYAEFPQLEFAMKMGEFQIVDDLVVSGVKNHAIINWKAKDPAGFYRMKKQDFKRYTEKGGQTRHLRYAKTLKKTVDEVLAADKFLGNPTGSEIETFFTLADAANLSTEKAIHYLGRQNLKPYAVLQMWKDYIDMAGKVGLDLTQQVVAAPKILQEAHDMAASLLKIQVAKDQEKTYGPRKRRLKKRYEFHREGLCILVPESSFEIVEEGQALRHCVAGYAERHIQGKTVILFLREEKRKDTSLVTIEMNPDGVTIRQIHGFRNDMGATSPRVQYKDFLDIWLDWVKGGSQRTVTGEPVLNIEIDMEERTA